MASQVQPEPSVAVIVPCYNEEIAVGKVIADIKAAVPEAIIYVYDNNSSDRTAAIAAEAGACVRFEVDKGKGNVVRRAFADVEADIYALIDGDDTYDASALPEMIHTLIDQHLDHVLGVRTPDKTSSAYRPGHETGNKVFNRTVKLLFGDPVSDMLSGYRVMSRRFVKSFPALSREFEIETEMTIHCMSLRVPRTEVPVGFKDRPAGSESKLRTYHDGFRILRLLGTLLQYERPMLFYGVLAAILAVVGLALGIPVIWQFVTTGLVPRLPTAILASSLIIIAILALMVGLILNVLIMTRNEAARLSYLSYPAFDAKPSR
ncbi:MAG: glycosyltransferase [Propionibacteriaceae bacterium]|nr:glycosyltransferase [Propionibacteriaceae bacterium]